MGIQIAQAFMMLIAFVPVLWNLGKEIDVCWVKNVPGILVWASLLISIGGICISWLVGFKLPKLEYDNQKAEAAFRKQLVHAEDDKIYYAATVALIELFTHIRVNYRRLFLHHGYFDLWINWYDQIISLVPYLVMGPSVFMGVITLGMLQQVIHAFEKVHGSLSLFLHNWTVITEFRSIRLRLREFEDHLESHEHSENEPEPSNVIPFPAEAAMQKTLLQGQRRPRRRAPMRIEATLRRFSKLFGSRNEKSGS